MENGGGREKGAAEARREIQNGDRVTYSCVLKKFFYPDFEARIRK